MDDAGAPVIIIRKNHKVVCEWHLPLSPLPRAGGRIEYVDLGDLHTMGMPNGSEKTYRLSVIIQEEPLGYSITTRPKWSTGYHPRDDRYSNYEDTYQRMRMHKTGECHFQSHGVHWSVEAI